MPQFIKVATTDEPRRGAVVRRDGRGNRGDLPLARGEVRPRDRGAAGAAGSARAQEQPGEGHWHRQRDRGVRWLVHMGNPG